MRSAVGISGIYAGEDVKAVSIAIRYCTARYLPPRGVQRELSQGEPGSPIDKNRNLRVRQNLLRFRAQQ